MFFLVASLLCRHSQLPRCYIKTIRAACQRHCLSNHGGMQRKVGAAAVITNGVWHSFEINLIRHVRNPEKEKCQFTSFI